MCRKIFLLLIIISLLLPSIAMSQPVTIPSVKIGFEEADSPKEVATTIKIVLLLTILSLAPAFLIMLTSFARIVVVLSFLRQAMGTHQMPPNQILIGLALFLTFFIMSPVWQRINSDAVQPYMSNAIGQEEAFGRAVRPLRRFMMKQTREKDIGVFIKVSGSERPKDINDVPTSVIVPAFIISELRTAFQIGFLIYVPFLILDMVIASVLMSMGMLMLPPIMISLPFKLLLFVLIDGWNLIVGSLVKSFM